MAMLSAQYPTNLQALYTSGSPILAGMAQQQFDTAQANETQNMSLAKQLYQQSQDLHPLELQQRNLQNLTSQAQLPGMQADSASKVLKTDRELQTQGDAIAQLKAKLKAEASDSDLKILNNLGGTLSQIGALGAQSGAVPLAMLNKLPKEFHQFASNPSKLKELGDAMLAASSERQSEMAKITAQGANTERVAKIQSDSQKALEEARIAAGKYANHEQTFLRLKAISQGPSQAAVVYREMADEAGRNAVNYPQGSAESKSFIALTNQYSTLAEKAAQQALAEKAAAANEANRGKPDLGGFDIKPVNPNPSVVPAPGVSEPGKPQSIGNFNSADEVKAAFKSGKLSKEAAVKILREKYGMQ